MSNRQDGAPQEKILHGNRAKIDPQKKIDPLFATNSVTISERKEGETPLRDDSNVEQARETQEELKL